MARRHYAEYAGFRAYSRNPINLAEYVLYDGIAQALDTDSGRWQTVCETHGTICSHETLALAKKHLQWGDWCEACREELEGRAVALSIGPLIDEDARERNDKRYGGGPADSYPCLLCGAPVRSGKGGYAFWLHDGGSIVVIPEEGERRNAAGEGNADLGTYPIGRDCYAKHERFLAPFKLGKF
jgi:hypothetical protein